MGTSLSESISSDFLSAVFLHCSTTTKYNNSAMVLVHSKSGPPPPS